MTPDTTAVRMRTSIAGPQFSAQPGDVVRLPPMQAARLIVAGYAEPVGPVVPAVTPEAAVTGGAPETAMRPAGRARRR